MNELTPPKSLTTTLNGNAQNIPEMELKIRLNNRRNLLRLLEADGCNRQIHEVP